MVTNLPAEARAKWIKVMEARTIEEKIRALEEFLSAVPKHKGTANLRLWATRRLAELREELEERKRKRGGRGVSFFVEKEGAAQIVVIGLPNSGKSTLVKQLTGTRTRIADYPFSTNRPVPGMLRYQDIYFQLVDTPPLRPGGGPWNNRVIGLVRNSDAVIIVLNNENDPLKDYLLIKSELEKSGILLYKPQGRVVIEKERAGKTGIRVTLMGKIIDGTIDDVRKIMESYRVYNAHIKIYGIVTLDDVEQALFESKVYKPSVIVINKADLNIEKAKVKAYEIHKLDPSAPIIIGSAKLNKGFEQLGEILFKLLGIIRVYTKQPNGPIADKPLILREGATIYDVARSIHKDFVKKFKYAKIWGPSAKYPGERAGLDHIVMDGDIVEIHVKG
ncbi:small GTP-binding protein [Staphylothermus marinus F1]|uniref:Small GTP-binding protein n=1 Tax=Staphylothermus marinus (strain ATCC 43588 / DSM 3639 / JCM 9404 / F1) TaxID=399550 RepID=A3DP12_STAMF|nr:TGS domain-containing protein [Staphylothermus marinus]ABN70372.1 small GTP-binding protein [Staphylothermus marinus F1]